MNQEHKTRGFLLSIKIKGIWIKRKSLRNYEYALIENPLASVVATSLTLKDSIKVTFKFQLNSVDTIDGLVAHIQGNNRTWDIPASEFEYEANTKRYLINFTGFHPGLMEKQILVTLYKDGEIVSNTASYSIESYALGNAVAGDAKLAKLVDAMIRYGRSAKAYNG